MLFSTTTHTTTTTKKTIRDQREKEKIKITQKRRSVRGSIKSTQKIKITQRERSVRGFVARRLWVAGEVEGSWVEGSGSKIGSWVRRSVKSKSKAWSGLSLLPFSLSLSLFACESGNGLKWKFWLKPISELKPLKHTVNWKYFLENLFSMRNQTLAFTEKHFRKWFEAKTNTA